MVTSLIIPTTILMLVIDHTTTKKASTLIRPQPAKYVENMVILHYNVSNSKLKLMSQPTAHQTMINNYNPHWFVDSISSHHVMNGDLNNLALYHGYEGTDHIISGDGSVLPICHLVLHTFPQTLNSFFLSHILCVSSVYTTKFDFCFYIMQNQQHIH